jgi:hypothetical protein
MRCPFRLSAPLVTRFFVMVNLTVGMAVMGSSGGLTTTAAEPTNSTDEALLRSLLGEEESLPSTSPTESTASASGPSPTSSAVPAFDAEVVRRIVDHLEVAKQRLADGQTGEETRFAQAEAITELERLIEAAKNQSQSHAGHEAKSPQPQAGESLAPHAPEPAGGEPTESASSAGSAGTPTRNREGKAEESSERAREERERQHILRGLRSDLVREAWGHLPPRLRDQLLNMGDDRYLPQYDALVRRYFESLAQPTEPRDGR